jgi:hypothetical protein
MESNFEPGRHFVNHLDFPRQLDAWLQKTNARTHRTLRARPIDRVTEERRGGSGGLQWPRRGAVGKPASVATDERCDRSCSERRHGAA